MKNMGTRYLWHQQARSSGIAQDGQLAFVAFYAVRIRPSWLNGLEHSETDARYARGSTTRHAMAMGYLRALPASSAYGRCAVDYSLGP
jgi:hypothetical protein